MTDARTLPDFKPGDRARLAAPPMVTGAVKGPQVTIIKQVLFNQPAYKVKARQRDGGEFTVDAQYLRRIEP